jgi:Trk K+ transport system NAD-binding subunit
MAKTTRLLLPVERRRRAASLVRKIRAVGRDSLVLWREFRAPILTFVLVTLVGGFVYGELYYIARGQYIDVIVRPHIMLQLMVLETPGDVPSEWFLVLFWYALPPIGVFIIGRGVVEFVRLFFNRDARRDAWREAVASTYRNHVIVFGAGHVGLRVIRVLVQMGFDVVVIDNAPGEEVEAELQERDVPLIIGDGRLVSTLEKARLRDAESFVACIGNDYVNLEAIMKVRDLNPGIRIVARMWDDQNARQIERFMNVQAVLSSSDLSAPIFAGSAVGIEITQTLRINNADYSMIRVHINADSFMRGETVEALQHTHDMDIVLLARGDHVEVQPARNTIIHPDDTLVIFARHDKILSIVARNRGRARV